MSTSTIEYFIHVGIPESVLEQAKSEFTQTPQECMVKYAAFLKEKYRCLSVFPDSEWPPSVGDQYIRLALIEHVERLPNQESISKDLLRGNIDAIEGKKRAISISDVFTCPEGEGKTLRVLMDGAPGVGKTTLCRKVSKDWACEAFLSEYKLVVVLHLRDQRIAKAATIEDLFYHDDPELQGEVVRQVRKTSGAGVLLIFDGFDELSEGERMDRSLFLDIIKGEVLSRCSVLITSRPYASENLQRLRTVVRHVEVLGFTKEQIHQCITNAIKDVSKAQALVNILEQRADVISLCYTPLNCAILLYVYQQRVFTLPDTLTELYEMFILHALKRHAKLQSAHRLERKICSLMTLPSPLNDDLDRLCTLAFNGLVKNKMVFQYEEIETAVCTADQEIEAKFLGLLTAFKSFPAVGDNTMYQFLHLTIQEFLAARWVATHMSPEEQAKFFMDHHLKSRFKIMLLFLAGITKLDDSSFGIVFIAKLDFLISGDDLRPMVATENCFFHLVHFLYEAQNTTHCHTLACAIEEQTIVFGNMNISPFLFLAFAFFLRRSNCTWKRLDFGAAVHSNELDILCEQLEKASFGSVSIQQLQVEVQLYAGVFPIAVDRLARIVRVPAFRHVQKLEFMGSPLLYTNKSVDVRLSSCTGQELTNVHFTSSDLDSLRYLIRNRTLEELGLLGVLGVDDGVIEKYIAPTLAETMTLKLLDIGSVNISNKGLCSLFHALKHNKSVEILHVQQYLCGDLRSLALAVESALRVNQTLKVLSFIDNAPLSVADTTAQYPEEFYGGLFRAAAENSTLTTLTIADESFLEVIANDEVLLSLIGMLHKNKSLTSLSISVGQLLTSDLVNTLAKGLAQNPSLTKLCVRSRYTHAPFDFEPLLFDALCQNLSLKTLVLDLSFKCVLRKESFDSFLNMLRVNKSLTSITFNSHFTDDQLKVIARSLVLNSHRAEIELDFNFRDQIFDRFPDMVPSVMVQRHNERVIQGEVNKYKRELFDMIYFVYHVYEIYHRPL